LLARHADPGGEFMLTHSEHDAALSEPPRYV
jgi:hypothetical protein